MNEDKRLDFEQIVHYLREMRDEQDHPSEDVLIAFVMGHVSDAKQHAILEEHLQQCPFCAVEVEEIRNEMVPEAVVDGDEPLTPSGLVVMSSCVLPDYALAAAGASAVLVEETVRLGSNTFTIRISDLNYKDALVVEVFSDDAVACGVRIDNAYPEPPCVRIKPGNDGGSRGVKLISRSWYDEARRNGKHLTYELLVKEC